MAAITGILTAIQGIPTVAAWRVAWHEEAPLVASSATQGAIHSVCGVVDWEGWILGYGHTPAYLPGDTFTFRGSLDGQKGVQGDAVVHEVRVIGDVANKREIMIAYSLVGQGALSFGTVRVTDTTPPVIGCPSHPVLLDDEALEHVTFWQIVLRQDLPGYVSTSTRGMRKRLPGVFQALVQWRQLLTDTAPPVVGEEHQWKIVIEPAQDPHPAKTWSLSRIRIVGVADYGVDLRNPRNVTPPEYEITANFQALVGSTQQTITDPSGRRVWPRTGT